MENSRFVRLISSSPRSAMCSSMSMEKLPTSSFREDAIFARRSSAPIRSQNQAKLLSYPKKTFTRQQLMDEFWDADTDTAPRAVDVYMTKLRSKLSSCEDFEIKTVHGLGYKAVVK